MLVKNPLDSEVTLNYKGEVFHIEAGKTKDFPEDIAKHWVTIYQFMTIEAKEEKEEVKPPKEVKKK